MVDFRKGMMTQIYTRWLAGDENCLFSPVHQCLVTILNYYTLPVFKTHNDTKMKAVIHLPLFKKISFVETLK